MHDIHRRGKAKLDDIRSRLYERGAAAPTRTETPLTDDPIDVTRDWQTPPEPKVDSTPTPMAAQTQKKSPRRKLFRKRLLLAGLGFFLVSVLVSTLVMFFGGSSISADNISMSVNGPFTVGGGETLRLQIGVTNANAVPISAATLILNYPPGTRSPEDDSNLFVQRIPLDTIRAGETINVPVQAVVFGEENSEQRINVSIEYRVEGSNATFFRDADPYLFKISSAPVALQADSNIRVSSGQETELTLTVAANSQATVRDVIVTADYPTAFDYSIAEPAPVRGQNTWRIESLEPGEQQTITIRGVVVGKETDELAMHFSVGAPDADDPTKIATVFNTVSTELAIENPFVDIVLELDGETQDMHVLEPSEDITGRLTITNSLSDSIYDTTVNLQLGGNALSDPAVSQTDGYYDSLKDLITWSPATRDRLSELRPDESVSLTFAFAPNEEVTQTPVVTLSADVESRRVRENRVPEILTGSTESTVRVATLPTLISEARRTSGPVPPTLDETTDYTLSILAETASNNLNNVTVTAKLPPYVTFGEQITELGTISFNETSRMVTWEVGNVTVGDPAVGSFSIRYRPSVAQIGKTPILMESQYLRAEDAFTGSVVRAQQEAVTTELSTELGFESGNGRVVE